MALVVATVCLLGAGALALTGAQQVADCEARGGGFCGLESARHYTGALAAAAVGFPALLVAAYRAGRAARPAQAETTIVPAAPELGPPAHEVLAEMEAMPQGRRASASLRRDAPTGIGDVVLGLGCMGLAGAVVALLVGLAESSGRCDLGVACMPEVPWFAVTFWTSVASMVLLTLGLSLRVSAGRRRRAEAVGMAGD